MNIHQWATKKSPDYDLTEPVMDSVSKGYLKSYPEDMAKGAEMIVKEGGFSRKDVEIQLNLGRARAKALLELAENGKDMSGRSIGGKRKKDEINNRKETVKEWDDTISLFKNGTNSSGKSEKKTKESEKETKEREYVKKLHPEINDLKGDDFEDAFKIHKAAIQHAHNIYTGGSKADVSSFKKTVEDAIERMKNNGHGDVGKKIAKRAWDKMIEVAESGDKGKDLKMKHDDAKLENPF
jgi:hypothetical protein